MGGYGYCEREMVMIWFTEAGGHSGHIIPAQDNFVSLSIVCSAQTYVIFQTGIIASFHLSWGF